VVALACIRTPVTLWLLDHLSTLQLIVIVVGGATVTAIGLCLVVQRAFPGIAESDFDRAADAMRGGFTLLFGLILGLSISDVSSKYAAAQSTAASESTQLAQLVLASRAFPADQRGAMGEAIAWYDHAVTEDEWLTMRQGKESPLAAAALANLYGVYQAYSPAPGREGAAYTLSMSKIDQLTTARRSRLGEDSGSLPGLLRILLVVGVVVFNVVWYPASITSRATQVVVVGSVAAFTSFAYLLTVLLDFPFVGDLAVSNLPYSTGILATYWHQM
jgi:hypothetical protein